MTPQEAMQDFDSRYPAMADLRKRAYRRMPKFAFEYLDANSKNGYLNKFAIIIKIRSPKP